MFLRISKGVRERGPCLITGFGPSPDLRGLKSAGKPATRAKLLTSSIKYGLTLVEYPSCKARFYSYKVFYRLLPFAVNHGFRLYYHTFLVIGTNVVTCTTGLSQSGVECAIIIPPIGIKFLNLVFTVL